MRVSRLCRKPCATDPLSGKGGLFVPGRWHPTGTRIVHTSSTLSLAVLEMLVHTDRDLLPPDLVEVEILIPAGLRIARTSARSLPGNWRETPSPEALRKIGAGWIARGREAILQVPSAVIPKEPNFLLNPAHRDTKRIRVVGSEPFLLDPRLWGQAR